MTPVYCGHTRTGTSMPKGGKATNRKGRANGGSKRALLCRRRATSPICVAEGRALCEAAGSSVEGNRGTAAAIACHTLAPAPGANRATWLADPRTAQSASIYAVRHLWHIDFGMHEQQLVQIVVHGTKGRVAATRHNPAQPVAAGQSPRMRGQRSRKMDTHATNRSPVITTQAQASR